MKKGLIIMAVIGILAIVGAVVVNAQSAPSRSATTQPENSQSYGGLVIVQTPICTIPGK